MGLSLTWVTALWSLSKNINSSLVLVQPWKTHPYITERLLMGRKESNQSNKSSENLTEVVYMLFTIALFTGLIPVEGSCYRFWTGANKNGKNINILSEIGKY